MPIPAIRPVRAGSRPVLDQEQFDRLSVAEKHAVAKAEIGYHTLAFENNAAAARFADEYWGPYVDSLPRETRQAVRFARDLGDPDAYGFSRANQYLDSQPGGRARNYAGTDLIPRVKLALAGKPVPEGGMTVMISVDYVETVQRGDEFGLSRFALAEIGTTPSNRFARTDIVYARLPEGFPTLWLKSITGEDLLAIPPGTTVVTHRAFLHEDEQIQIYGHLLPPPSDTVRKERFEQGQGGCGRQWPI